MKFRLFLFALFGLLASCTSEIDQLSPPLRQYAQNAYQIVLYPCETEALTQKRKVMLAVQAAKFSELEMKASGAVAGIDFALAKQMTDHEIADGANWNCSFAGIPYSKLDFDHEQRRLTDAIQAISKLLPQHIAKSKLPNWIEVANAAKFRSIAHHIYDAIDPLCPITVEQERLSKSSPARIALAKLSSELSNSPYGRHLMVAKADVEYLQSITSVECSDPSRGDEGRADVKKVEDHLLKEIDRLKLLISAR